MTLEPELLHRGGVQQHLEVGFLQPGRAGQHINALKRCVPDQLPNICVLIQQQGIHPDLAAAGSQLAAGVALGVEIYNQHPLVIIPCQNVRKTECGGGFADSSLGVQHRYCFHVVFAPFDSDRRIIFQYP